MKMTECVLAAAATSGAGRPAGHARLASKPVIVAMTPELPAVAIDHPRRDCLGGAAPSSQWEQPRARDLYRRGRDLWVLIFRRDGADVLFIRRLKGGDCGATLSFTAINAQTRQSSSSWFSAFWRKELKTTSAGARPV